MTINLPCIFLSHALLRHCLCPLGVPLSEAPGSVDQGSLPASRSVCTLGRNGSAPQLVLAVWLHLPQRFPHCCTAVLCSTAQCEGFTQSHVHRHGDSYSVKQHIRRHCLFYLVLQMAIIQHTYCNSHIKHTCSCRHIFSDIRTTHFAMFYITLRHYSII